MDWDVKLYCNFKDTEELVKSTPLASVFMDICTGNKTSFDDTVGHLFGQGQDRH